MNFDYVGDDPNFFNITTTQVSPPGFIGFGRQGWICPKCGRVYAPDTAMCFYCNGNNHVMPATTTTTTTKDYTLNGPYIYKVEDPLKEPQITLDPRIISERMFYVDPDSLPYY